MKPPFCRLLLLLAFSALSLVGKPWDDVTEAVGLAGHPVSQLKFADLNGDSFPDVILIPASRSAEKPRVFIHPGVGSASLPAYRELTDHGLPPMTAADILVFADLDNDGIHDAILGRYLDFYQEDYEPPAEGPTRNAWIPGRGDGTFGEPRLFEDATLGTTRSVAIGDINFDGRNDVVFGNWYERYFSGYECFPSDVLLQYPDLDDEPAFIRWPLPGETLPTDYHTDLGGRPTYGVLLPRLDDGLPFFLELNYGRRWNRLYQMQERSILREIPWGDREPPPPLEPKDPRARGQHLVHQLRGRDIAPEVGVDGDAIRHGRHPKWPLVHADARPRSKRPDEPPFRANGNEFDAAVGDIDNDGDFDLVVTTIIHAWAGESSDRSRFLVNQLREKSRLEFLSFERLSIDRIPELPEPGQPLTAKHTRYNQGDIYAELADLNHDGRLDLVLCSSDYPDPPPHDERLRLYFQQADGRFLDVTHDLGIDQLGAGMPSLADIDRDGDLDIIVGQSFNRLTPELRRQAAIASGVLTPDSPEDAKPERRARVFRNNSAPPNSSILLFLEGDPSAGMAATPFGAHLSLDADLDGDPDTPDQTQIRQLIGPGGHAGKQSSFAVHFGLGAAGSATTLTITWPGRDRQVSSFSNISPGRYRLHPVHGLTPVD